MKKIAVLTWFNRGRNYGQTLQAFALNETLRKVGYQCELLSYGKNGPRLSEEEINQLTGDKRELQIKFTAFIKQHINYSVRLRDRESIENYLLENDFDVVLCGSDQIWNPFILSNRGPFDTAYFLDFKVPYRKVSYAASMVDIRFISEYDKYPQVPALLENFDAVSVRENTARTIVQRLTSGKVDAVVVLDPTLLLTQDEWIQSVEIPPLQEEKYIFCYMFYVNRKQRVFIQRLAEAYGCKTVIFSDILESDVPPIGDIQPELAKNISIEMFLALIRNATAVVTDSFHGTVFSIQFEKKFFVVENTHSIPDTCDNGKPCNIDRVTHGIDRITTLLEKAGLTSRLLKCGEEDAAQLEDSIDYADVRARLASEREKSLAWLERAIG